MSTITTFISDEILVMKKIKHGKMYVFGTNTGKVYFLDSELKLIHELYTNKKGAIYTIEEFEDDKLLIGGSDLSIHILDYQKFKIVEEMKGHQNSITSMTVLESGTIISGSFDGKIYIWSGDSISKTIAPGYSVTSLLGLSESMFMSGDQRSTISIWDLDGKKPKCIK